MATKNRKLDVIIQDMVEQFQCAGCTKGNSPDTCKSYSLIEEYNYSYCKNHSAGTFLLGIGRIGLGLPKGFNRYGKDATVPSQQAMSIRLYAHGECPPWDYLNVPVWRMEDGLFLFVRTYAPRNNQTALDIIRLPIKYSEELQKAYDVSEFIDDID